MFGQVSFNGGISERRRRVFHLGRSKHLLAHVGEKEEKAQESLTEMIKWLLLHMFKSVGEAF